MENTNRAHSSSHCPLPVLSQQCHSAQEQRPPFCLARGLKNQSHVQEIHPARLSFTECLIVHGSTADLEGLPIFGAVEQPRAVACTDLRTNTQSHTIPQTKEELSRLGLRIHTKQPNSCVLPLHSRCSALQRCPPTVSLVGLRWFFTSQGLTKYKQGYIVTSSGMDIASPNTKNDNWPIL